MDIEKTLAENPDTLVTVEDGASALEAIRKLDVKKYLLSQTESNAIEYAHHPTHWIVAMVLAGGRRPEPIHRLICFPKSSYTEKDIADHLNEYTRDVLPFDGE